MQAKKVLLWASINCNTNIHFHVLLNAFNSYSFLFVTSCSSINNPLKCRTFLNIFHLELL
jgi:hypothetical protein